MIIGKRLKQARECRGLTQADLANESKLAQSVVSRLEIGNYPLDTEDEVRLADILEVPLKFLACNPVELPDGSLGLFRSYSSKVKSTEYRTARRLAEIGVEALLRLAKDISLPPVRLKQVPGMEIEQAAMAARSMLRLPLDEPIENLTVALERSGALILRISSISEHIAGFSSWIDPIPALMFEERPLIVTRRPLSPFRLRFTIAHELGHLLLGHNLFSTPQRSEERDAHLFASALLMPKDPLLEDLEASPITLRRLAELKSKWGASMHALAMRARHLTIIDEFGYRSIYETMRSKGFLKKEPGDDVTHTEQPRLLNELIERHKLTDQVYDVAEMLDLGVTQVRRILGIPESTSISDLLGTKN